MIKFLQRFSQRLMAAQMRLANDRLRQNLLDRDDRFLTDAGFSRELLEAGVHAWPWRVQGETATSPAKVAGVYDPLPEVMHSVQRHPA